MATRKVCWSCGLRYDGVFDRCPTAVLGCGAEYESLAGDIDVAELLARRAQALVGAIREHAKRKGSERTHAQAKRLAMTLTKVIGDVEMLTTTLRNDKAEQRDARDSKAVGL